MLNHLWFHPITRSNIIKTFQTLNRSSRTITTFLKPNFTDHTLYYIEQIIVRPLHREHTLIQTCKRLRSPIGDYSISINRSLFATTRECWLSVPLVPTCRYNTHILTGWDGAKDSRTSRRELRVLFRVIRFTEHAAPAYL